MLLPRHSRIISSIHLVYTKRFANIHVGSTPGDTTSRKEEEESTNQLPSEVHQTAASLVPLSIPAASLTQALQAVSNTGQSLIGANVRLQLHGSGLDNTFAQFQVDEGLLQQI